MTKKWVALGLVAAVAVVGCWAAGPWFGSHDLVLAGGKHGEKELYYCPMHPSYTADRPGSCPICNMNLVRKEPNTSFPAVEKSVPNGQPGRTFTVQELVNMKPGEICLLHKCKCGGACSIAMTEEFARLGKCPQCGDSLDVLVKDLIPTGYSKIALTPERRQLLGVKTSPAQSRHLIKTIRASGRIAYDPDLYQTQEEYLRSLETLKNARQGGVPQAIVQAQELLDSSRMKLKLMGFDEELVKALETAGKPDRSLLYADQGNTVWLYADIFEQEVPLVKVGDEIEVDVPGMAQKKFHGKIRSMNPVLDTATRSLRVRCVLENPQGVLRPEMFVNAGIRVDLGKVLVVPQEAVFSTGRQDLVFVSKSDGEYEPRQVELGARGDGFVQIKGGLAEGDAVVTSGNFLIVSERRLKAALEEMVLPHEHR